MSDRTKYLYQKNADYLYFRFKGKFTKLPIDRDSAAFRAEYDAAFRAAKLGAAKAKTFSKKHINAATAVLPGTLGAAIDVYMDSAAYNAVAPSSREQYCYVLNQMRARLGSGKLADLDTDAVDRYTDGLTKECGGSTADRHMRMISNLWQACRKFPQFNLKGKSNPTLEAEKHYSVKQKHRPWPLHVQEAFMKHAPDRLKLAKLLLHFSAQRGCDCIVMRWADYDGKGINVRPRKTHGDVDALPNYHLCPKPLREALDAAPRVSDTILVSAKGKPYATARSLAHAIKVVLAELGHIKPNGRAAFVMHGLRKTAASDVGSLAVGAAGVKSVGGWRTDSEANYYAQHADQRRVNALVVEQWDAQIERQERDAKAKARRAKIKAVR